MLRQSWRRAGALIMVTIITFSAAVIAVAAEPASDTATATDVSAEDLQLAARKAQLQQQALTAITPERVAAQIGFAWPLTPPELSPPQIRSRATQLANAAALNHLPDSKLADAEAAINEKIRLRQIGEPVSLVIRGGHGIGTTVEGRLAQTAPGRVRIGSRWVNKFDVAAADWLQFDADAVAKARQQALAEARDALQAQRQVYAQAAEPKLVELLYERQGYIRSNNQWVAKPAVVDAEVTRRRQAYVSQMLQRESISAKSAQATLAAPADSDGGTAAAAAVRVSATVPRHFQINDKPVRLHYASWSGVAIGASRGAFADIDFGINVFYSSLTPDLNLQAPGENPLPLTLPLPAALPMLHQLNGMLVGASHNPGRIFVLDPAAAVGNSDDASFANGTILASGRGLDNTLLLAFSGTLAGHAAPGSFLVRYEPMSRVIAAAYPLQLWQAQQRQLDDTVALERFTIPPATDAKADPAQVWQQLLRQHQAQLLAPSASPARNSSPLADRSDLEAYRQWQATMQLQEVGPDVFWFAGIAFELDKAKTLLPNFRFPNAGGNAFYDAVHQLAYVVQAPQLYVIDTSRFTIKAVYPSLQAQQPHYGAFRLANERYLLRLAGTHVQVFHRHSGILQTQQQLPTLPAAPDTDDATIVVPLDLHIGNGHAVITGTASDHRTWFYTLPMVKQP